MPTMRLTGCSFPISDVNSAEKLWCVYEHWSNAGDGQPPRLIYINACRLTDTFRFKDARDNSEWFRIYQNGGAIMVNIVLITEDRNEATRQAIERCKAQPTIPQCNLHGWNMRTAARPILCSNGVTYQTQAEAATALNLAQSNISRCLRGQLNSVGGYRFAYAATPDMAISDAAVAERAGQ